MKSVLKLLLCAVMLGLLATGTAASAQALPDQGFTISSYAVRAVISESNVYDITEVIKANFTEAKHGLVRTIPINGELTRKSSGGAVVTTRVTSSVTDVKVVGYKYSVSTTEDMVTIKIGDANKTVTGEQTYRITYKLRFGDDHVQSFDEAYFNILGTEWPVTIDKLIFSVTLPKDFDKKKLGFSMGPKGHTGYDKAALKFTVDGDTIAGKSLQPIDSYEGLTMRLELPQGYFDVSEPDRALMGIFALLTLVCLILFLAFGKDKRPVQTVEFYPPEGMTPTEIGYVNDGCVDERDAVSLLMYFADKGYLSISEIGENMYRLKKLSEIDENAKDFEKLMFSKLFHGRDTVTTDALSESFYKTVSSVEVMAERGFYPGDRRVFDTRSLTLQPWMSFLASLPLMATLFLTLWRVGFGMTFTIMIALLVGIAVFLPMLALIHTLRNWRKNSAKAKAFKLIASLVLVGGAIIGFLAATAGNAYMPYLPWSAAACTVIMALCAAFIPKRTPRGVELLGKINGFREFIIQAERPKLLELVEQNPSYFFNILPYAYVLGVADKWAKNFESIVMTPPDWYDGFHESFSPTAFTHSLNSTMTSFQVSMTSSPSSSSSGGSSSGFSSGSSSGGGGGGGGGGSW